MKYLFFDVAVVAIILLVVSACETSQESVGVLAQARDAVAEAESDPDVVKYAPTELERARRLLTSAEGAAKENGPRDQASSHNAYLATQMARISRQRAQEQVSAARIKAGEAERRQLLLTMRTGEASAGAP